MGRMGKSEQAALERIPSWLWKSTDFRFTVIQLKYGYALSVRDAEDYQYLKDLGFDFQKSFNSMRDIRMFLADTFSDSDNPPSTSFRATIHYRISDDLGISKTQVQQKPWIVELSTQYRLLEFSNNKKGMCPRELLTKRFRTRKEAWQAATNWALSWGF